VRILFASWPAHGHLLPMVPLIRAAQRAGHQVVVSSGADLQPLIHGLGVESHTSGLTLAESYAAVPHGAVLGEMSHDQEIIFAARHLFGARAVDRANDLLPLVRDWRPDLIVHDTLELGSPTVAQACGVQHVTHGYGPTVPGTDTLAALIGQTIADHGLADPTPAVLAAPYLEVCPPGLATGEPIPWPDVRPIRPGAGEIPPGAVPLPELDDLPPAETVYLTLGTITNQSATVFRAAIDGIVAAGLYAFVTTGPSFDPAQLGTLPAGVLAVPFVPQALLLPHCRVVVSHAGAGTMFGALCHGLPMLCLPQGTDQPAQTTAVLRAGAGLALWPGEVTADGVQRAVERLLAEPEFAAAAGTLQDRIAAMPDPDVVLAGLGSPTCPP
jgi:UDP:flavonoid glycosyltransferase YjiC (YdhE family)